MLLKFDSHSSSDIDITSCAALSDIDITSSAALVT